jgi:hypothetical protein
MEPMIDEADRIIREAAIRLARPNGLTIRQGELLSVIRECPGVQVRDAAYLMRTSPQAVGRILRGLTAKSLAYQCFGGIWPTG